MKKLKWLILVMCLVLGLSVFVACGNKDGGKTDDNTPVEATGVTLAETKTLEIGQTTVLTAILDPMETNVALTWASSNPAVATVSDQGQAYRSAKVTAVAKGETDITLTVSGKTATCKVTVTEHLVPYWFIAGASNAALFNWEDEIYRDILDTEEARVLTPDATEKVFTTEIDLYVGDMFKLCKLTEKATESKWDDQVGGNDKIDPAPTPEELTVVATEEAKTLSARRKLGSDGNPKNYEVADEGKYEIKLDMSGDTPVVTYKRTGDAAEVAAPTSFDLYMKGDYNGWKVPTKLAGDLTGEKLSATFTVKYEGEAKDFGLFTVAKDKDATQNANQIGWAREDLKPAPDFSAVEGISDGTGNWSIGAGVYEFAVTIGEDGKFTKVEVTSGATADDKTFVVKAADGYDIRIKGGWVNDWSDTYACATGLKGENLTATFTLKYVGEAKDFGFYVAINKWDAQTAKGWCGESKNKATSTAAGLEIPEEGNYKISEGVYKVTVEIDEEGQFVSISVEAGTEDANTVVIPQAA